MAAANTDTELDVRERDIDDTSLTPGTIENGVLVGKDKFLFLAGGAHSVLDIVNGKQQISEQSLARFRSNIVGRQDWARCRGIPYVHLVFPDKQTVVPEMWPYETCRSLGQLYLEHFANDRLPILFPVELIQAYRWSALSKVDTHVTAAGSIIVAAALVARIEGEPQDALRDRLLAAADSKKWRAGDLGSKFSPPIVANEGFFSELPPGTCLTNGIEGGNNGLTDLRFNPDAVYRKRCVVFGDSFGRDICLFLQYWYAEVFFFRSGFFHTEVAELCDPDVLVTENVERYLDACVDDGERTLYFMFPHLKGLPYAPPISFARKFSDILTGVGGLRQSGAAAAVVPQGLSSAILRDDEIEAPRLVPRTMPAFVIDQSKSGISLELPPLQDIHGSHLVEREKVLLFGPSIQVFDGTWSCETRAYGQQYIDMTASAGYGSIFPGPKPKVIAKGQDRTFDFTGVAEIKELSAPLFLATPLEPTNWGRWISTVIPKITQFRQYGCGRKLLCIAALPWQRRLLRRLGVQDHEVVEHDVGYTYRCRNLATVEYNVTNMTVSTMERDIFSRLREQCMKNVGDSASSPRRGGDIFISRLTTSRRNPDYRVLQNEVELIDALKGLNFDVVEPETLSFEEQVAVFGGARSIVCLGGAAIYNAVFCREDARVVSLESSDAFLNPHTNLLSSLGLRYGVIVGIQDATDQRPVHRRWTVDVARIIETVERFTSGY